jgi:predicted AAA+ superfamily ATPase
VHLDPVNHTEALQHGLNMQQHWFRGGFPMALTAESDQLSASWLDNFISTYIERDLSWLFGRDFSRSVMRNFWGIAAHNNGTIWNASSYSRSLGVSVPTVKSYAELLEGGFLLRLLPAWYLNAEKRLIKSPKIYWRDSGLVHRICRVTNYNQLFEHPVVGGSWEGYVVEQIAQHKHPDLDMYYYRTQNGAECDVVLTRSIKPVACIEIKLNNLPKLSEGYFKCIDDLRTKHNYIVTPEGITSPYYGATACSLPVFLKEFLPFLATVRPK